MLCRLHDRLCHAIFLLFHEYLDGVRFSQKGIHSLTVGVGLSNAGITVKVSFPDVNCSSANCSSVLVQQNLDGSKFFNRSWAEFKVGFGIPSGNYWLGNDELSQLTLTGRYKVRFNLQQADTGSWYYVDYNTFRVQSEADNYKMYVSGYSGNAAESFRYHNHNVMMFSTYDRDNDRSSSNCAASRGGGFWHKRCDHVQINLPRVGGSDSFSWNNLSGGEELQTSRMWLHCK